MKQRINIYFVRKKLILRHYESVNERKKRSDFIFVYDGEILLCHKSVY